jgi:hypothetical protein
MGMTFNTQRINEKCEKYKAEKLEKQNHLENLDVDRRNMLKLKKNFENQGVGLWARFVWTRRGEICCWLLLT